MRRRTLAALALVCVCAAGGTLLVARHDRDAMRRADLPADVTGNRRAPAGRVHSGAEEAEKQVAASVRPETIRGIVLLSPEEVPARGAHVALHRRRCEATARYLVPADLDAPVATATTDEDGRFELTTDPEGDDVVVARLEGCVPAHANVWELHDVPKLRLCTGAPHELLVTDTGGAPIAAASILRPRASGGWQASPGVARLGSTGADGRCTVLAERGATIVVAAEGFASRYTGVDGREAEEGPRRIVLEPELRVTGLAVDEDGRGLEGVSVVVGSRRRGSDGASARSAADGTFTFLGLPRTDLASPTPVSGSAEGRACVTQALRPGRTSVRLVLPRAVTVRGVVVHEDGTPVRATSSGVSVDAEGRFEITGLAPGTTHLRATAPSRLDPVLFVAGEASVTARPGEVVESARIVLRPPTFVSYVVLRIVGPSGSLAWYAEPSVYENGEKLGAVVAATRRDDTLVVSVPRPAGTLVQVVARDEGHVPLDAVGDALVATAAAPPLPVQELLLRQPSSLRLDLEAPDGTRLPFDAAYVNEPERYSADGVRTVRADETVHVVVTAPGCARREVTLRPPHAERRVETLRLERSATIAGRIVDADGRPAAWREPVLALPQGERDAWSSPLEVSVDADGRFEVSGVPAGPVRLRSMSRAGAFVLVADARAGETSELGDVRTRPWAKLRGRVLDDAARPLGAARVHVDGGLDEDLWWSAATDANGTFELYVLAGARARLVVRRSGFGTRALVAAPGAVEIALQPSGALRVDVNAPKSSALRWTVSVAAPDGTWWWDAPARGDWSWDEVFSHRTEIADLPPGRQRVRVASALGSWTRDVTIVAGKTVDLFDDR